MKKSPRGLTPVIRLCSLFQGRVHAGTLDLYSSKLSILSTFVKIYLRTLVKNNVNCQHSQLVRDVIDCSKKLSKNFPKLLVFLARNVSDYSKKLSKNF